MILGDQIAVARHAGPSVDSEEPKKYAGVETGRAEPNRLEVETVTRGASGIVANMKLSLRKSPCWTTVGAFQPRTHCPARGTTDSNNAMCD